MALLSNTRPSWVMSGAAYDFDFANQRFFGLPVWQGQGFNAAANRAGYNPAIGYGVNSGTAQSNLYTQFKDGILRVNGPAAQTDILRMSDYGLWIEGGPNSSNNYCLQCRDLTQAVWTATTMTVAHTATGADGIANKASLLTATAGAGAAIVLQTISQNGRLDRFNKSTIVSGGSSYAGGNVLTLVGGTGTAATLTVNSVSGGVIQTTTNTTQGSYTVFPTNPVAVTGGAGTLATFNPFWQRATLSCWIKRVTGTGTVSLTANGGASWTDISGQINSNYFVQVRIPSFNLINNIIGIQLGTNSDSVIVDFFQCEDDDQATSPILTTTSVISRSPENIFIGTNSTQGNAGLQMLTNTQLNTPFTYMFTYSGNFSTTLTHAITATDAGVQATGLAGGGTITANMGSDSLISTGTDTTGLYLLNNGSGVINKLIMGCDGTGAKVAVNGVLNKNSTPVLSSTYTGTHNNLGNNGANVLPCNGYTIRMTIWKRLLTDGEMIQYSTVTNNA